MTGSVARPPSVGDAERIELLTTAAGAEPGRRRVVLPGDGAPSPLLAFRFPRSAADPAGALQPIAPDTPLLQPEPTGEDWLCPGPLRRRRIGAVDVLGGPGYATAGISVPLAADGGVAAIVAHAYRTLLGALREAGYPQLVRSWNFIPQINAGRGEAERYKQFCVGRGEALDALGVPVEALSAATAVGTPARSALLIVILAAAAAAVHVDNPRQTRPVHYPQRYGPRSPSFARATLLGAGGPGALLLASGTASIRGHASVHTGDLGAQLGETLANLAALVEAARAYEPRLLWPAGERAQLRVYLRRGADAEAARAELEARLPGTPLTLLQADICRRELDVELEAVLQV